MYNNNKNFQSKSNTVTTVTSDTFTVEEEADIKHKVEFLGGKYSHQVESFGVLIVKTVLNSTKYEIAVASEVPVVNIKWLVNSFEEKKFLATKNFKLRALEGLRISLHGFNNGSEEDKRFKKAVKEKAHEYGAKYVAGLCQQSTHLIVRQLDGLDCGKCKYALSERNRIQIITSQWWRDSTLYRYCRPVEDYRPKNWMTLWCDLNRSKDPKKKKKKAPKKGKKEEDLEDVEEEFEPTSFINPMEKAFVQPILNGGLVYLCGYGNGSQLESEAHDMVRSAGAFRSPFFTGRLTHVILHKPHEIELKQMKECIFNLSHVVVANHKWLIDSVFENTLLDHTLGKYQWRRKTDEEEIEELRKKKTKQYDEDDEEIFKEETKEEPVIEEVPNVFVNEKFFLLPVADFRRMDDKIKERLTNNSGTIVVSKETATFWISPDMVFPGEHSILSRKEKEMCRTGNWVVDCIQKGGIIPDREIVKFYHTPVFVVAITNRKLNISIVRIWDQRKKSLRMIIDSFGGKVVGAISESSDVLVIPKEMGECDDIKKANQLNIPILLPEWLEISAGKGMLLDFDEDTPHFFHPLHKDSSKEQEGILVQKILEKKNVLSEECTQAPTQINIQYSNFSGGSDNEEGQRLFSQFVPQKKERNIMMPSQYVGFKRDDYEEKKYKFILSSADHQIRLKMKNLIEDLGGEVVEDTQEYESASHCVVAASGVPDETKFETYYSLAAGLWVLKYDYLLDSTKKKRFIPEGNYLLMQNNIKTSDEKFGQFRCWMFFLYFDGDKEYKRLITVGEGTIVEEFDKNVVTHLVLESEDQYKVFRGNCGKNVMVLHKNFLRPYILDPNDDILKKHSVRTSSDDSGKGKGSEKRKRSGSNKSGRKTKKRKHK